MMVGPVQGALCGSQRFRLIRKLGMGRELDFRSSELPIFQGTDLPQRFPFPSLRHAIDDFGMFVAREAEVDEPFLVE